MKSDYTFDDSFSDFKHVRKMQWTNVGEWETVGKNVQKTLTDLTKQPDSVKSLEKLFENKYGAFRKLRLAKYKTILFIMIVEINEGYSKILLMQKKEMLLLAMKLLLLNRW